jgi:hypothetical protein
LWARYRFRSSTVKTGRVQCRFLCLYVVVNIANADKKLQTPADIIPLYARKILNISVERKYPFLYLSLILMLRKHWHHWKKLLRTTNYHHTKSCLVPIYIFCIIIILSFTVTLVTPGLVWIRCGYWRTHTYNQGPSTHIKSLTILISIPSTQFPHSKLNDRLE